jgi:hypothetical protein
MGQHSWNMFKVMFNHSNHKQSQPFQSQRMWVSNEKINEPVNIVVIQSSVLRMILGWDIPFVYPNYDCAQQYIIISNKVMFHVHPNISCFKKLSSMYMWFSSNIIILELVSSIHSNLLNLSSKQFVYLQLSSKKFIDVQFSSKHFIHFMIFIHVHLEKYFPCHSYMA